MGLFEKLPYVNFHQLNIDWVLEKVRHCLEQVGLFATRLDADEIQIETNKNDIAGLKTRMDTAEDDIDSLESRMSVAETSITANTNAIDALDDRMDAAEVDITHLEEQLARTRTSTMGTDLATAESDIDALERIAPSPAAGDVGKILTASSAGEGEWRDAPEEIPAHTAGNAGNVLSVDANGDLEWSGGLTTLESSFNASQTFSYGSINNLYTSSTAENVVSYHWTRGSIAEYQTYFKCPSGQTSVSFIFNNDLIPSMVHSYPALIFHKDANDQYKLIDCKQFAGYGGGTRQISNLTAGDSYMVLFMAI